MSKLFRRFAARSSRGENPQRTLQQCFEYNLPPRFHPVIGWTKRDSRVNRELSRNCKSPAFRQAPVPLGPATGRRRRCAGGESQETCLGWYIVATLSRQRLSTAPAPPAGSLPCRILVVLCVALGAVWNGVYNVII